MADVSSTFGSLNSTESNTANGPSGATTIGSGLDENIRMQSAQLAAWRDQTAWGVITLTSVAGSANTITATVASAGSVTFGPTALTAGMKFLLTPGSTNTLATNIAITSPAGGSSLGTKNIFWNGTALTGGELRANVPALIVYDGTQFHICGNGFNAASKVLGVEQASTSGTSIDFTGIPAYAKRITIQFVGVSTNGTSKPMVQIGDAGGIGATGYLGSCAEIGGATGAFTTGFGLLNAISGGVVFQGAMTLTLENASTFTWVATGCISRSDAPDMNVSGGTKSTSAALDRVRITTVGGSDMFDAGAINIIYE